MFIRNKGFFKGSDALAMMKRANQLGTTLDEVHEDVDGVVYVRESQDVEPILELNKSYSLEEHKAMDGLGYFAARVPNVIWEQWRKEIGFSYAQSMTREFEEYARKKLNDSENSGFRIWQGKL